MSLKPTLPGRPDTEQKISIIVDVTPVFTLGTENDQLTINRGSHTYPCPLADYLNTNDIGCLRQTSRNLNTITNRHFLKIPEKKPEDQMGFDAFMETLKETNDTNHITHLMLAPWIQESHIISIINNLPNLRVINLGNLGDLDGQMRQIAREIFYNNSREFKVFPKVANSQPGCLASNAACLFMSTVASFMLWGLIALSNSKRQEET